MEKKLINIFKKVLKINSNEIKNFKKKKYLKNVKFGLYKNWDSLTQVSILIEIKKIFKIDIDEDNIRYFKNFNSIKNFLKKY